MTYNPNIPLSELSPALQQSEIQTNFSEFSTIFANNHTAFNTFNQGDHEAIIFQSKVFIAPGVSGNYDVLYCNVVPGVASNQLFVQMPTFLPGITNFPMILTYNTVNTAGPNYQSFLPSAKLQSNSRGPYLFFFGSTSNIAVNITLSPAPSSLLLALAVPNTTVSGFPSHTATNIINNSTFKIISDTASGSYSFSWMAIGLA